LIFFVLHVLSDESRRPIRRFLFSSYCWVLRVLRVRKKYCHDRFRPNLTDSSDGLHGYPLFQE